MDTAICWFDLLSLLIAHFLRPFPANTTDAQASYLVRAPCCGAPDEARSSKIRQGILGTLFTCQQLVLGKGTGSPYQLEPGILLDV